MTPGKTGGSLAILNWRAPKVATQKNCIAAFGALGLVVFTYPVRRGGRGHQCITSPRF